MNYNRAKFYSTIDQAKAALSVKDLIPGLNHFWFDGKTVTAYNDIIGIELECETDFVGGVPGKILLGFLEKVVADEVTIQLMSDTEIVVMAGRPKITLPLLESDNQPWKFPEFSKDYSFAISDDLLKALKRVLISIGKTEAIPEQLGVTVVGDKSLHLYTTDAKTISWEKMPLPEGYSLKRMIIPAEFCEQLLEISTENDLLFTTENSVITETKSGVKLFSKLLEFDNPLNFANAIKQTLEKGGDMLDIPDGLSLALERIDLIRDGRNAEPAQFTVRDQQLDLYVQTPLGEVRDRLDIDGEHSDVAVRIDPALVGRALADRECFYLTPNALILQGPESFVHFVSTLQK